MMFDIVTLVTDVDLEPSDWVSCRTLDILFVRTLNCKLNLIPEKAALFHWGYLAVKRIDPNC